MEQTIVFDGVISHEVAIVVGGKIANIILATDDFIAEMTEKRFMPFDELVIVGGMIPRPDIGWVREFDSFTDPNAAPIEDVVELVEVDDEH